MKKKKNWDEIATIFFQVKAWLKRNLEQSEGEGTGRSPKVEVCSKKNVREKRPRAGASMRSHGVVALYLVSESWLLSLSLRRRGFQDLLRSVHLLYSCCVGALAVQWLPWWVGPSSRFLQKEVFLSCNLIIRSWLTLCSATDDFSVCASRMCPLCSLILIWTDYHFVQYKPGHIHMGCRIHPAFLIPKHPWQVDDGSRFFLVAERHFWCV